MYSNNMGKLLVLSALVTFWHSSVHSNGDDAHRSGSYLKWITEGRKLVSEDAAREFNLIFRPPTRGALPRFEDVVAIRAEIEQNGHAEESSFNVPQAYHRKLLERLDGRVIDQKPAFEWPEVASLKVYSRQGTMTRVCVYSMHCKKGPLLLSVHGIRFVVENADDEDDLALTFLKVLKNVRDEVK